MRYSDSVKVFAREACRNDLLNFGRVHFFFPDSRLGMDLSTDKTLKEVRDLVPSGSSLSAFCQARFDRHFVRDLTWSRHQLEDLAERRFRAAQRSERDKEEFQEGSDPTDTSEMSFSDLFKKASLFSL